MTAHGAASASKSSAALLASGASSDAASDIAGGDAFAALLAQVTPEPGKTGAHGHHKGEDTSDDAASDTPGASPDSSTKNTKGSGKTGQRSGVNDARLREDPTQISATLVLEGAEQPQKPGAKADDPSQIPQDTGETAAAKNADAMRILRHGADKTDKTGDTTAPSGDPSQISADDSKTDKTKKTDGKSGHHHAKDANKKSDADTDALLLAMVPATPPAATPPVALTAPASANGDDGDETAPAIDAGSTGAPKGKTQTKIAAPGFSKDVSSKDTSSASGTSRAVAPEDLPPVDDKLTEKNAGQQNTNPSDSLNGNKGNDASHKMHAGSDVKPATGPAPSQQAPAAPANAAAPAALPVRAAMQPPAPSISVATAPSAPAPASAPALPMALHAAPPAPDTALPNLNSFALDIAAKSHDGLKQFDIRMDPADLGRVDVSLSIDNSGKVQAHLTADQPQTLALLQKDSTVLRGALRDAGLNMAQNGLNFSLKGQNPQQQSANNGASGRGRSLSLRATAAIDAAQSVIPVFSSTGADTRLDIHV